MTVSASYAPSVSAGNDVTTEFSPSWPFFSSAEIKVTLISSAGVETVKSLTTHYTVSGGTDSNGLPATGTITMLTAPATGETLVIERVTTNTQATSYANNDAFGAKTHEAAYDRRTLVEQEAKEIAGRSLQANPKLTLTGRNFKVDGTGWLKWDDTDGFSVETVVGDGDMLTSAYDPAGIEEQLVGLTATQTLTNKTLTQPTITLKQSAAPTPTAEGDIQWDTDDDKIKIGDGASTKTFSDDSYNAATYQPLDADLTTIAAANNGSVLAATTASFLTADETKLDGIEALADVTDATNVQAAVEAMSLGAVTAFNSGDKMLVLEGGTLKTADYDDLPGASGAGVDSFNGRTGAVSPASGDYALADITGLQTALDAKAALGAANGDGSGQKYLHLKGGGVGYTASHHLLESAAAGRGLGMFGWDSSTGVEWFWGRPYSSSDRFIIARQAGITTGNEARATAQQAYALFDLDTTRMKMLVPNLWQGLGTFAKLQRAGQSYEKWQLALSEANGNLSISMINESTGATVSESVQINNGTGKLYNRGVKVLNDEDLASQAQAEAGTDNTTWTSPLRVAQAIAALAGGGIKGFQVFTSGGTYTRTSGATKALVIALGAGGGPYTGLSYGGSAGEMRWALVTPGATESVTIGSGGGDNANGGDTSFGAHVTAKGGNYGSSDAATGSGGTRFTQGRSSNADAGGDQARGGDTMFGQGGIISNSGATIIPATGYGSGAPGSSGSPGAPGLIIVIEF